MQVCVRCGNIRFNSLTAYKDHIGLFHAIHIAHVPENKTGRTKQEIVDSVEAYFRVTWYQAGHPNPFIGMGEIDFDKVDIQRGYDNSVL